MLLDYRGGSRRFPFKSIGEIMCSDDVAPLVRGRAMLAGAVYHAFGMALLLPAVPAAIAWLGSAGLTNQIMHAASNCTRALLRKSFEHYLPPAARD
jgi:hypothetical protein